MSGYGLTFSAWRGRLSGSLDVCNRRSSGVVWRDGLGDRFGEYTNQIVNKFTIQNKGWDGWLQWQVLHRKKLDWNLTLTVNRNRSKVLAILPEAGGLFRYALDRTYPGIRIYDIMDNLIEIGQPIGVWYGQVLAAKFSKRLTNSPIGAYHNIISNYVEDASFTRLENLSVAYMLPLKSGRQLNLSLTALNLKVWTKYRGIDPELNDRGFESLIYYPYSRSANVGVSLQL